MTSDVQELRARLEEFEELDAPARDVVGQYYALLLEESKTQNLTRLIRPSDFVEGHLLDVLELRRSGWLGGLQLDLGSGCGVPGLLYACIDREQRWVLSESEVRKREFLTRAVQSLGLAPRVRVGARGEEILRRETIPEVVSRAVGKISKIWTYLAPCSTWNTIILFKGPGWTQEWDDFRSDPQKRSELSLIGQRDYVVGEEKKQRTLVRLSRVPRRTVAE